VGLGLIGNLDLHAVSLGTSDTCFGYMAGVPDVERTEGHIFGTADGHAMFLVCFKNGSLARERLKDDYGLGWEDFSRILVETPPGNRGRVMLPYFMPEITPLVFDAGARRFGRLDAADAAGNIRAVAEAQAMAMHLHSAWVGKRPARIFVTAGGSGNRGLLTVIADVFGVEVQTMEVNESAALGAALRAAHTLLNRDNPAMGWKELWESVESGASTHVIRPSAEATRVYRSPGGLLDVYAACEKFAIGQGPDPDALIRAFRGAFM
jgi:xylulokinase